MTAPPAPTPASLARALALIDAFPCVWRHRKWPQSSADWSDRDLRHGQRCRVFARGRNGNLGVEFADGTRVVGVRYCALAAPAEAVAP